MRTTTLKEDFELELVSFVEDGQVKYAVINHGTNTTTPFLMYAAALWHFQLCLEGLEA